MDSLASNNHVKRRLIEENGTEKNNKTRKTCGKTEGRSRGKLERVHAFDKTVSDTLVVTDEELTMTESDDNKGDGTTNHVEYCRGDSGYGSLEIVDEDDALDVKDPFMNETNKSEQDVVDGSCEWAKCSDTSPITNEIFRYGQSLESKNKTIRETIYYHLPNNRSKPDQVTNIIIPHDYATDTEAGDFFGAKIATYRTYDKKTARTFSQHFFVHVDLHGPADKMKIENWDELLIVGKTFVPVLSHTDVLNLFHHVKVDGLTRLFMVIRRVGKHRTTPVTWHWYETSAVLAPDKHEKGETKVQKLEYKPLENNRYEMKYLFRFKITFTPNYLDIKASGINVGPLFNDAHQDRTKNIWQTAIVHEDGDSNPIFSCTLCDHNQKVFLGLDKHSNVVASNTEKWFEYQLVGKQIFFKDREQQSYLAFDNGDNKLTTKSTQYTFERYELPHHKDEVDSATAVNGIQRRSDDGSKRIAGYHSQRSSGYGSQESSFEKNSDTEMSACDTKLPSTNNRSYANGSTNRMTRSMSRQLSDVRRDLSDVHVSM